MKVATMTRLALIALSPLAFASAAGAAGFVDPAMLDARVASFAGAPLGEEGGAATRVDRRLKLVDCGDGLILGWRTERRDAVVVSCTGSASWKIFVPVRSTPNVAAPAASASGVSAARAEPVIRRGDPVTVQSGAGGFSVTTEGTAMMDAPPGARIRVTVAGSRLPIQAVAVQAGLVQLPGS
jgi:flagella basal body P-ring formation protein FlgA